MSGSESSSGLDPAPVDVLDWARLPALAPGSLLVGRFRVLRDESSRYARVVDASDELSGGVSVRIFAMEVGQRGAEIEGAMRLAQRYRSGVKGVVELLSSFEISAGICGAVYPTSGELLDRLLAKGERLDAARAGDILRGVEQALRALHEQGIAHGALMPQAVCLSPTGVCLLGFGLNQAKAKTIADDRAALDRLAAELGLVSTPQHTPPPLETARGQTPAPTSLAQTSADEVAAPQPALPDMRVSEVPALQKPRAESSLPPARRMWLGAVAIGLGALTMVGGVAAAWIMARHPSPSALTGPSAPSAASAPSPKASSTPATPDPPPKASAPEPKAKPLPHSEKSASEEMLPDSVPPLSPPLHVVPPELQAQATIPVDENEPAWGPPDAPVTITLFADLDCPHTRALLKVLLRAKTLLGNDLRWVFRHRPLSQHPEAAAAARLLAGVNVELGPGVFWKIISELAHDDQEASRSVVERFLDHSGIDAKRRSSLAASPDATLRVDGDLDLAGRLLVRSTPTLFVNGVRLEGFQNQGELFDVVNRERRAAILMLLSGSEPDAVYNERALKNFVNLGDDPPSRACVVAAGSPLLGQAAAPISVVEFCAYESQFCQKAAPALQALVDRHPRDVRLVWKTFPLKTSEASSDRVDAGRLAGNFALSARQRGGDKAFWAVHRALFEARAALDAPSVALALEKMGLDAEAISSAARAGAFDAAIDADVALGKKLGVTAVPTYYVNGIRKEGLLSPGELETLIRDELATAKRVKALNRGSVSDLVCSVAARSR